MVSCTYMISDRGLGDVPASNAFNGIEAGCKGLTSSEPVRTLVPEPLPLALRLPVAVPDTATATSGTSTGPDRRGCRT